MDLQRADGSKEVHRATREVNLSAGAAGSPRILILCGLGDAEHLRSRGISPLLRQPQIGRNFLDHLKFHDAYRTPIPTLNGPLQSHWGRLSMAPEFLRVGAVRSPWVLLPFSPSRAVRPRRPASTSGSTSCRGAARIRRKDSTDGPASRSRSVRSGLKAGAGSVCAPPTQWNRLPFSPIAFPTRPTAERPWNDLYASEPSAVARP